MLCKPYMYIIHVNKMFSTNINMKYEYENIKLIYKTVLADSIIQAITT